MQPIVDPRNGDIEDDASSTKQRSLLSLAGSLLAEISLPKLAVSWLLLIGLPALLLGAAPLLLSIWIGLVSSKTELAFSEILPALALPPLVALGWFAGRRLFRLAETSFWALNALAVQPVYVVIREGLRHLAERFVSARISQPRRASVRAGAAAGSGVVLCLLSLACAALAWPATRWIGSLQDLGAPVRLAGGLLANSVVLVSVYVAAAALAWGIADATMAQPQDLAGFVPRPVHGRTWRVAHLSDLHAVGERYGFRVESGRSGPRGNERLAQLLARLQDIHAADPLDVILITGDLTDAGRSAEWAEFFDALAAYPALAALIVALPGNHDLNVVDRASPARMELPSSTMKRQRQIRTMSALGALQGTRARLVDRATGRLGPTLAAALEPLAADMVGFADTGSARRWAALSDFPSTMFPQVLPPDAADGLGIVVLNSNAETHFSFTNALGLVSLDQVRAAEAAIAQHPRASWIVALHHHVVEYPQAAKALSERIGTALINGSWFVRRLQRLAGRVVVMHGHRHVDWVGACGDLLIVSAPSPVMDATDEDDTYFYVHTIAAGGAGKVGLVEPERVGVPGRAGATVLDRTEKAAA